MGRQVNEREIVLAVLMEITENGDDTEMQRERRFLQQKMQQKRH